MDVKQKQKKGVNITVVALALVALLIYVGFYFLVSSK